MELEKKSSQTISPLDSLPLAELHVHLGSCATPEMMWELAHAQGIKLPTKDFRQFQELITLDKPTNYADYLKMFDILEKIQSSPEAMFAMVQQVAGASYRENNVDLVEYRGNPILRSRHGEIDLDHLIVFTLQGMERTTLKYPLQLGFILCMDRRLSVEENSAIIRKAIKYKDRGIVGIDLAGPIDLNDQCRNFHPRDLELAVAQAHEAGLGVTIHTGEATGPDEMWAVIKHLRPQRIGHGIACTQDPKLMEYLREQEIVLETCPTSNLKTKVIKDWSQMRQIYANLKKHAVPFTINTDGPILQKTTLRHEYTLLLENEILTPEDLIQANHIAHQASFIKKNKIIKKGKNA